MFSSLAGDFLCTFYPIGQFHDFLEARLISVVALRQKDIVEGYKIITHKGINGIRLAASKLRLFLG